MSGLGGRCFERFHTLLLKFPDSLAKLDDLIVEGGQITFPSRHVDSYIASVLSDFIRVSLIEERVSFTFETVMSDSSKIELLRHAKAAGYRVYVYYVATADTDINVARVAYRTSMGGHDVPADKIRSRYKRALENLSKAILLSNRTYIFDNSQRTKVRRAQAVTSCCGLSIECSKIAQALYLVHLRRWNDRQTAGLATFRALSTSNCTPPSIRQMPSATLRCEPSISKAMWLAISQMSVRSWEA